MEPDNQNRFAMLELSAGCIQEAVERLLELSPRLHNAEHEAECIEIARDLNSHVTVMLRLCAW